MQCRQIQNRGYNSELLFGKVENLGQNWGDEVAKRLHHAVCGVHQLKKRFSIMLTGGQSAAIVYKHWANDLATISMPLEFFFGDERCVPPDNKDSNYKMVMDTLFTDGLPEHFLLHRIKGELKAYEKAAESYSELIP